MFLWSTGFIGMRYAAPYSEPLTFLAWRFAIVALLLTLIALATHAPWPTTLLDAAGIGLAGILLQAIYLGGVFLALTHGLSSGTAALIVSTQPVLVAVLAGPLLGEHLNARQWAGIALGLLGVVVVVAHGLGTGTPFGTLAALIGLVGITAGTLWQKRYCPAFDLRTGSAIQFAAAALLCLAGAMLFENGAMNWNASVAFALVWLVLVLSVGAISLLFVMIRDGQVARVSALFFLVPPVTAMLAWLLFGERLAPSTLIGMALAMLGVALVSRAKRVPV